jgi:hypothetical protein
MIPSYMTGLQSTSKYTRMGADKDTVNLSVIKSGI